MSKQTQRFTPPAAPVPPSISKHFNMKSSAPSRLSTTPDHEGIGGDKPAKSK
jgi:hypothetical protein